MLPRELPQPQVHERSQLYRSRLRPFLKTVPERVRSELGLLRCRCRHLRGHLVVHAGDAEAAMRHVPHLHDRVGQRGGGKAWSVSVRIPIITETALTSIRDATVRAPNDVVVLTMLSFAPLQHQVQENHKNNYQFQGTTARGGGARGVSEFLGDGQGQEGEDGDSHRRGSVICRNDRLGDKVRGFSLDHREKCEPHGRTPAYKKPMSA